MTTIYDELRALFPDNEKVRACIRIAELGTPPALARAMCDEAKRLTPGGETAQFWRMFWFWDVWEIAFFGTENEKQTMGHLIRNRRNKCQNEGRDWPPTD